MGDRVFSPNHNLVLDINLTLSAGCREILTFLNRSRIRTILTASPQLYSKYLCQFWETLAHGMRGTEHVLTATVHGQFIQFSGSDLIKILSLGTIAQEDGPTEFSVDFVEGALKRMGFVEKQYAGQYPKNGVLGQWRYFFHVMINCLNDKKSGFDRLPFKLVSALVSLVYNKPYSFSRLIFGSFVAQLDGEANSYFMLYPRFTMMILNHLIPNLPKVGATLYVSWTDQTFVGRCMTHYIHERHDLLRVPVITPLFGYLIDINYVTPPNGQWEDVVACEEVVASSVLPAEPLSSPQTDSVELQTQEHESADINVTQTTESNDDAQSAGPTDSVNPGTFRLCSSKKRSRLQQNTESNSEMIDAVNYNIRKTKSRTVYSVEESSCGDRSQEAITTVSNFSNLMGSSPQCGTVCIQGYNVKQSVAPILEAIFKKHGDIAADCLFKTDSVRSNLLEVVCEVVTRIETNDVIDKMEELECNVSDAEAANINVSWLKAQLKRNEAMKKWDLLMETKVNTSLVKRAAQMDLREQCEELLAAQERFRKAERCARVLYLVENNLKNAILESKAENALLLKEQLYKAN